MPWVRFTQNFSWVPDEKPQVSIAYKRGMVQLVTTPCAQAAIWADKAERTVRPK